MFEHVSSLCAHLRQCVCPVQPLHIPGNTNINSYFFSWNACEDGDSELLDYYRGHDGSFERCVVYK